MAAEGELRGPVGGDAFLSLVGEMKWVEVGCK